MSEAILTTTPHQSGLAYLKKIRKNVLLMAGLASLTLLSFLLDISIGSSSYSLMEVIQTIIQPEQAPDLLQVIVWDIRLPIALIAVIIGAILALAGAQMQTILNNPLADPFTLGISSAASFGAALAIVTGISLVPFAGAYAITGNAFVFALAASFAIYGFTRIRGVTVETMVLVGIALMFTFNALLALLQYGASETQLQQVIFWMMGSLQRVSWNKIAICTALLVICLPYCLQKAWQLMALRMGDERARTMGVNVKALRIQMLVVISLLASVSVAFVGAIGFIGLVAPHIARMMVGEDQRFFLPVAALNGALILSLTSIISKSIVPGVIYPISVITSLIGIPFFYQSDSGLQEKKLVMSFSISNLNFSYRRLQVLKDVTIKALPQGQFIGVLGANGAGKSTLFKCISDALTPSSGEMNLAGESLATMGKTERTRRICYMPQHFQSNAALTVFDVVMLARKFSVTGRMGQQDIELVARTLDMLQIEHLAQRNISELSGGQQQMVSLAQATIRTPELLLLDEPTSALDLQRQLEVMELIRQLSHQRSMTTMVAIHDLNLAARFADTLVLMSNGTVINTGTPAEVLTQEAILEVYGVKAEVKIDAEGRPVISPIRSVRNLMIA